MLFKKKKKEKKNLSYNIRYYKIINKNNHFFFDTLIQYI